MESMYKEELMEIYSDRKNFGHLENKTHSAENHNPACEDKIKVELIIKNGKIKDAKFSGKTCFISTVSAEVLMEKIKDMTLQEAQSLKKENLDKFLGINVIPTRIKCELLALEALQKIE